MDKIEAWHYEIVGTVDPLRELPKPKLIEEAEKIVKPQPKGFGKSNAFTV
jgi:hypothetical protein